MADAPQDSKASAPDAPDMDRRTNDRRQGDRRKEEVPVPVERREAERRQVDRRAKRSINQYDLEADTLEFINAINEFKRASGRSFPTWSQVLEILRSLGYEKRG